MKKQSKLTSNVDNVDGVNGVVAECVGHVQRLVWLGRVSKLVLIRIEVLLRADHVEDLGQGRTRTDPHQHLLRPRQIHRESLRRLAMENANR